MNAANRAGCAATVGIAAGVLWVAGCGGGGGSASSLYGLSVQRMVALQLGLKLYENDFDDGIPLSGKWMDELVPYVHDSTLFHSPGAVSGYGYALNAGIAGQYVSQFSAPDTVISLYDSTDLSRNATDPTSTLPVPPRYGTKNTIGYLDGTTTDQPPLSPPTLYAESRKRLGQDALGVLMYANDYDDVTPRSGTWMDALGPYVKIDSDFRSPAIQAVSLSEYGYAFSSPLAGTNLAQLTAPASAVILFDSTDLSRNATASTTTLPNPPRYGSNNTIAYADGHVR